MVVTDSTKTKEVSIKELAEKKPQYINYLLEALELLIYENDLLRKIASKYSHDLRSPVTNIDMLLQLYEKAGDSPDKDLYISKMVKSIQRLQEGFEELSSERKSLLLKPEDISTFSLDDVLAEVKQSLPGNIALSTDFTAGKQVTGSAQTLKDCLVLLLEPFAETKGVYAIEINSERSWNGLCLNINYPEYLNIGRQPASEKSHATNKNAIAINPVLAWNYYFAELFLRTMGATATLNENPKTNSIIHVSFKPQDQQ